MRLPEQLRRLYRECDGFREDRGNAKYLLSLTEVDDIGSLVSVTEFWWAEWRVPDLRPFVFFGWSGGGDCWGVNTVRPAEVIAYHHNMGDVYEVVGSDMLALYLADYRKYEELEGSV